MHAFLILIEILPKVVFLFLFLFLIATEEIDERSEEVETLKITIAKVKYVRNIIVFLIVYVKTCICTVCCQSFINSNPCRNG